MLHLKKKKKFAAVSGIVCFDLGCDISNEAMKSRLHKYNYALTAKMIYLFSIFVLFSNVKI